MQLTRQTIIDALDMKFPDITDGAEVVIDKFLSSGLSLEDIVDTLFLDIA